MHAHIQMLEVLKVQVLAIYMYSSNIPYTMQVQRKILPGTAYQVQPKIWYTCTSMLHAFTVVPTINLLVRVAIS